MWAEKYNIGQKLSLNGEESGVTLIESKMSEVKTSFQHWNTGRYIRPISRPVLDLQYKITYGLRRCCNSIYFSPSNFHSLPNVDTMETPYDENLASYDENFDNLDMHNDLRNICERTKPFPPGERSASFESPVGQPTQAGSINRPWRLWPGKLPAQHRIQK